jgi:aminoglycoside 2'-N-acetyltransferase I
VAHRGRGANLAGVDGVSLQLTEQLAASELDAVHDLLQVAFEGSFGEDDWRHTLGGVHAVVRAAGVIVAHAAVVPRTLRAGDRPLSVGYVEGVGTLPAHRGRGHATRAMQAVGRLITGRDQLGALSTPVPELYARLGWEPWRGATYVDAPGGRVRTPDDDDGVMILRTARTGELDLTWDLTCDWRAGDVW